MAVNAQDSMNEGLKKMLGQIGLLKIAPDADNQFLLTLEAMIVERLKQTADQGAGVSPGAAPGASPDPSAMMSGMGSASPMGIAPGGGGGMSGLAVSPPNMDELRRVLSGTGASG